MKHLLRKVLVVWLLFISCHTVASEVEIPANAKTAWISNNINQNGMLLSIRTFESTDPVELILEFYRQSWLKQGDLPGFIESDMMGWKLISQLREEDNVVLQLRTTDHGGASGFLSIAKINGTGRPVELDFPLPDATEEFSATFLRENGADVHTMTFITKQSIGETSAFYRDRLKRQGWSVASDSEVRGSQIMLFNRRNDRCELVIQKLNGEDTVIFVNRVQRNV